MGSYTRRFILSILLVATMAAKYQKAYLGLNAIPEPKAIPELRTMAPGTPTEVAT